MNPQIILQVGAEGGSIKLLGDNSNGDWRFLMTIQEDYPDFSSSNRSEWVDGWEAAMVLMSRYSWQRLYPLHVHPQFTKHVRDELYSLEDKFLLERWEEALNGNGPFNLRRRRQLRPEPHK